MNKEEFSRTSDFVVGTLMELGRTDADESKKILRESGSLFDNEGQERARKFLLGTMLKKSFSCQSCERSKQRVYPTMGEGALDAPMLIGDYPGYADTLCGRVFSGGPEILESWGGSPKLEEFFRPLLFPRSGQVPEITDPEKFRVRPSIPKQIELPMAFQAPGKRLRSFVTSGQVLDRILIDLGRRRAGWGKADVYLTNSVLCPSIKDGESVSPTARERKACRVWLEMQIKVVRPTMIICLGKEALAQFFPSKNVSSVAGTILSHPEIDVPLGVTYHPGSVIRYMDTEKGPEMFRNIRDHLEGFLNGG